MPTDMFAFPFCLFAHVSFSRLQVSEMEKYRNMVTGRDEEVKDLKHRLDHYQNVERDYLAFVFFVFV